jgi:Abscisic acid G-protein coupled receptor/The Golgi pH Regulator (GPHR) Family N-terminal
MDAALLTATASLSIYLPRWVLGYPSGMEQISMTTAFGLSLGLLSLSILEAAPSRWLLFLSHYQSAPDSMNEVITSSNFLTISRMYYYALWTLSIVILFIFPSLAGASLADSFRDIFCRNQSDGSHDDGDDKRRKKNGAWKRFWTSSPWWIRFTCGLAAIVVKNMCQLVKRLCLADFGTRHRSSLQPIPSNIDLNWTRSSSDDDQDVRRVESGGVEPQASTSSSWMSKPTSHSHRLWMIVGGLIGVITVLVVVGSIGPMVVHTNGMSILSILVSWLCAVGLLISSLLNGFGSVSMPYTCLAGLYLTPVRPEVIMKLEGELQSVREAMARKRTELRDLTVTIRSGGNVTNVGSTTSSSLSSGASSSSAAVSSSRWTFGSIGGEVGNRRQVLQTELEFLHTLCQDMMADIEELRYSQSISSAARTSMGKLRSYVGLVFSIILLARLGSAAINIWQSYSTMMLLETSHYQQKVASGDVVTKAIVWLSGHDLVSQKDLTMLSQVVSLGLTALLTFSQARTFFRAMAAVNRRLTRFYQNCSCGTSGHNASLLLTKDSSRLGISGGLMSGLFSQLLAGATGSYFLSCIVLMKMMLPAAFCQDFANAMGGTDVFSIHSYIVNIVFACSAGVSLSILGMLFGIQRQNTLRHTAPGGRDERHRIVDAV